MIQIGCKCCTAITGAVVMAFLACLLPPLAMADVDPANPALSLLNEDIVFYQSFDHEMMAADMSVGEHEPVALQGTPRFAPGRFGKALVIGSEGVHQVDYAAWPHIDLAATGAMSFWFAPKRWLQRDKVDERPYLRFFHLRGARGGLMFIQRMGFRFVTQEDGALIRRDDRFQVGYYGFPDMRNAIFSRGGSVSWADGEWHFVVINWDRNGYSVSLDGSVLARVELSRPLTAADFPSEKAAQVLRLGSGNSVELTLIDEFTVYRRPLTGAEIEQIHAR